MKLINFLILIQILIIGSSFAFDQENDCKCRIPIKNRIIGGNEVQQSAYPWQVALSFIPPYLRRNKIDPKSVTDQQKIDFFSCGGIVINEWYVLTAAHCIPTSIERSDLMVGFGDNDLVRMYDDDKYIEIDEFKTFPGFRYDKIYRHDGINILYPVWDAAILKLKKPLVFDKNVQPACLTLAGIGNGKLMDGTFAEYKEELTFTGWGSISNINYPRSRYLKAGITYDKSMNLPFCERLTQNICVENNETICKGDSGGPLMINKDGRAEVIGIASWVDGDPRKNLPGVYLCNGKAVFARLSYFHYWIKNNVGDSFCS